jgi:hypothetical protein
MSPQLIIEGGNTNNPFELGMDNSGATAVAFLQSRNKLSGAQFLALNPAGGNVGIGTVSPTQALELNFTGYGGMVVNSTDNAGLAAIRFDSTAGAQFNQVQSGHMEFRTADTERMRILAGGGLTFNGDTADANALDDYEEGSWTPTYVSTGGDLVVAGYSSQFGRYVKIGKMCQVNGAVQTSGITTTGTGTLRIAGLPFGIANISGGFIAGAVGYSQNFVTVNPQTVLGMPNTSQLTMRYNVGTDARSAMTGGMTTSNLSGTNNHNYIIFSITYTVTGS